MAKDKVWIDEKAWNVEKEFRRKRKAELFPIMNKTDEEIEAEVRALEADGGLQQIDIPGSTTIWTNKEGIIQFEIAMRKEVRRLLNK